MNNRIIYSGDTPEGVNVFTQPLFVRAAKAGEIIQLLAPADRPTLLVKFPGRNWIKCGKITWETMHGKRLSRRGAKRLFKNGELVCYRVNSYWMGTIGKEAQ